MKSIATLTMNPTIDVAYEVEKVYHTRKMRTVNERYCPGGGGINVARVFVRLGGNARCYYLSGGSTGPAFDGLVDAHQLDRVRIPIAESTRIATAVFERETGCEYRFTPEGPIVSEEELQLCLSELSEAQCDYMVLSGSLSRGVPADFYARIAKLMRNRGIEVVLDSSGDSLREGLSAGGIALVKPSIGELQQLAGRELKSDDAIAEVALKIVKDGRAKLVAVTMGHRGALLASEDGTICLPAVPVEAQSAVGAGDSFLAGMVHALASGKDKIEAFRFGMAAGSAAVLTAGTGLAYPEDIERLFAEVALP